MTEQKSGKKDIYERLSTFDRRIMFWLLFILVSLPYIRPFAIPMEISTYSRNFYNAVQGYGSNSTVLVSVDIGLASMAELGGGVIGLADHLSRRGAKVVAVSTGAEGPILFERYFQPVLEKAGYKYGIDFVNLGFAAGGETMISRIAEGIKTVFTKDYYGGDVSTLKLMQSISTARDFTVAVTYDTGSTSAFYSRQWEAKYRTPVLSIPSAGNFQAINPLVQAGSVLAALNGPQGCAEYEQLLGAPGMANRSITALSMGHLLIVFLIVFGNIVYFLSRRKKKEAE